MGRCFSRKKTILRCIEKDAQFLLAIPKKRSQVSANTWLAHTRGRCTNVFKGVINLRIQHRGSCGEGGEKQPAIYLVEHIWWCIIWCLAGEDWVCIHCNDVPRMVQPLCAGCAKDDSIEFIKWRSWGVLKIDVCNSVLRCNGETQRRDSNNCRKPVKPL